MIRNSFVAIFAGVCASFLVWGTLVHRGNAHGLGEEMQQTVGEYVIHIGYDTTSFVAGETTQFSVLLLRATDKTPVEFDSVLVSFLHEGTHLVGAASMLPGQLGNVSFTETFPFGGKYEMRIRFTKGDETVVEAVFPFGVGDVSRTGGFDTRSILLGFVIGFVAGGGAVYIVKKK